MKLEEFLEMDLKEQSDACRTIAGILRNRHDIGRLYDEPCENCGANEVYCGFVDLGFVDWYNNYWHICLNCLDTQHHEDYTGATQESGAEGVCAFCGYNHISGKYAGYAEQVREENREKRRKERCH